MFRFSWISFVLGLLAACSLSHPSHILNLKGETGALLVQIDALESSSRIDSAPSLLQLMQDPRRDLSLRARAAGALAVFGDPKGIEFCLGCITAGLEGSEERDRRLSIPFTNRMAFVRELATRSLAKRLHQKGIHPPFFSANFGAPQLREAERKWRALLSPPLKKASSSPDLPRIESSKK